MGIVVEFIIQFVQCTIVRRLPTLFDLFLVLSGAALLAAGIACLKAGNNTVGAILIPLGVFGLAFGALSYRERRRHGVLPPGSGYLTIARSLYRDNGRRGIPFQKVSSGCYLSTAAPASRRFRLSRLRIMEMPSARPLLRAMG